MEIQSVHLDGMSGNYEVTLTDGTVLWVPRDSQNSDYARVQEWVADGGVLS